MKKTLIVTTMMLITMTAFSLTGCAGKSNAQAEPMAGMANPWQYEVSPEDVQKMVNESFTVPEGAENVVYGIMESAKLAEVQFDLDGVSYCARMEPATEFTDISGMYYTWDAEGVDQVNGLDAQVRRAISDEEEDADNVLFYDADKQMKYSISAVAPDLDGFDLVAVADMEFQ